MDNGNLRKTLTVESKIHKQLKALSKSTGIKIAALVDQLLSLALRTKA